MKSGSTKKWLAAAALAFVMAVLSLQYQSARAQFGGGFGGAPVSFSSGPAQSMIERGGYLYVMRGEMIYKIREKDLKIERSISLTYPNGVPTATPGWEMATPTPTMTPGLGTPRLGE